MDRLVEVVSHFDIDGEAVAVEPLGQGLINDTFKVFIRGKSSPQYVLQRINNAVFTDVDMLQDNIEKVTAHIRAKLLAKNEPDMERKVLHFLPAAGGKTYYFDGEKYWRLMVNVHDSVTYQTVNPHYAYVAGRSFGDFQSMLADIKEPLGEVIPNFHNVEFRLQQLRQSVACNVAGRAGEVKFYVDEIEKHAEAMCLAERLYGQGKLPKRICHCDTKVNNMLFDADGNVLCIIDLDMVMPSFVFSDFGDFLRTAANTGAEDDANLENIDFDMSIFEAFTRGYLERTRSFLLPVERENLPYAALLFPYMQAVRFLTDYINGDTYYKIQYPGHNLVRTKAQWRLFEAALAKKLEMDRLVG